MNVNALTKYYDTLTPWERLPALLAASARGDEPEAQRRSRTAPVPLRCLISLGPHHRRRCGCGTAKLPGEGQHACFTERETSR
jgi:hypothetical protein